MFIMQIYIENHTNIYFDFRGYKKLIETVIKTVFEMKDIPDEFDVNVMIVDPAEIREINAQTRGIDSVTDVLSFPYQEFDEPGVFDDPDIEEDEVILGDIVICADRVVEQAREFGHSQKRELAYLVTHSMLHLIGYDHMTPEDEEQMSAEAEKIMIALNITR